jgi:TRAP transporter TAXI family solute receptor
VKKVLFILLALVLAFSVGLIGCTGQQEEEEEEEEEMPDTIVFGTGPTMSSAYPASVAMCSVMDDYIEGTLVKELAVGAPPASLASLYVGESTLAWCTSSELAAAWEGVAMFDDSYPNYMVFSGPTSVLVAVALEGAGISSYADVENKTVVTYATNAEPVQDAIVDYYGWDPWSEIPVPHGGQAVQELIEGNGDWGHFFGSHPDPNVLNVMASRDVVFLSMTPPDLRDAVIDYSAENAWLTFVEMTVPADTYDGQTEALDTIGEYHVYVCRCDASEYVIYTLVKALFDHEDELQTMLPEGYEISLEHALDSHEVPYHPGAVQYFEEAGVWTSAHETRQQELLAEFPSE